jgi:hypothetical protein
MLIKPLEPQLKIHAVGRISCAFWARLMSPGVG